MFLVLLAKPFWFFSTLWFESWTLWKICCIKKHSCCKDFSYGWPCMFFVFLLGLTAPMFCVVFDSAGILQELLWHYRKMLVISKMDKYVFWNLVCLFCLFENHTHSLLHMRTHAHTHAHAHTHSLTHTPHLKITGIKMIVKRHGPMCMKSK